MSTYQKYLKDENDNIFSPIVSIDSIYGEDDKKLPTISASLSPTSSWWATAWTTARNTATCPT